MEASKVKVRSPRGGALGLLARVLMPLVLVYATWNPSGRSFYHWVIQPVFDGTSSSVRYAGRTVSFSSGATLPARLEKVVNRLGRILRYS